MVIRLVETGEEEEEDVEEVKKAVRGEASSLTLTLTLSSKSDP